MALDNLSVREFFRSNDQNALVASRSRMSRIVPARTLKRATHNQAQQNGGVATYLLPLAFPEGSPTHPSYGHATVAGACVTLLKAFFEEAMPFPNPVVPDATGQNLVPYTGMDAGQMTVGGELNKLASNVAIGRNIAGVHWRSDGTESLYLGEEVAIALLRDHKLTFNEHFAGWRLTRFDGRQVVI
jgi:hypothetical protein